MAKSIIKGQEFSPAAASVTLPKSDLGPEICIHPGTCIAYAGSRQQLMDAGVITAEFQFPSGTNRIFSAHSPGPGEFEWSISRCRPNGYGKGGWKDVDHWRFVVYSPQRRVYNAQAEAARAELRHALWWHTPEGDKHRVNHAAARADTAFQRWLGNVDQARRRRS